MAARAIRIKCATLCCSSWPLAALRVCQMIITRLKVENKESLVLWWVRKQRRAG